MAKDAEIAEGALVAVTAGEETVLLARVQGRIHAVGRKCPHYEEKLEKGALFGSTIVCKSHLARMDVTTGRVLAPPAYNDLPVYPVKVEAGEVWVGPVVKPSFPRPKAPLGSDPRVFVIVGAGGAGNIAAETLRRQGFAGRIVMITGEADRPYDRPNLSKDFLTGKIGEDYLALHSSKFYPNQGIELLTGRNVTAVDTQGKTVTLDGGEVIRFDRALLATGGTPRKLPVPGADGNGCFMLRSAADARAIVAAAAQWKSAVLIGAGFIGLELAGSLRDKGLEVTVVAPEKVPLAGVVGERVGMYLKSLHESREVRFLMGRTVSRIEGEAGSKTVTLSDGVRLSAGFLIIGLGITAAVGYLAGTGLVENGAVPVDAGMKTRAADIWAAGDMAAVPDADWERRRVEHWVAAQRQGQRAAMGMLDLDPGLPEVDFFWTRQAGASLKYVGHAREFDEVVYRGVVEEGKFVAGYYRKGALKAAATIGIPLDVVALERLMRHGRPPSAAQLADPGYDLMKAAKAI